MEFADYVSDRKVKLSPTWHTTLQKNVDCPALQHRPATHWLVPRASCLLNPAIPGLSHRSTAQWAESWPEAAPPPGPQFSTVCKPQKLKELQNQCKKSTQSCAVEYVCGGVPSMTTVCHC